VPWVRTYRLQSWKVLPLGLHSLEAIGSLEETVHSHLFLYIYNGATINVVWSNGSNGCKSFFVPASNALPRVSEANCHNLGFLRGDIEIACERCISITQPAHHRKCFGRF
jgi:hypothetical protein